MFSAASTPVPAATSPMSGHVAHRPALDGLARLDVEVELERTGLRGVAGEVALVLQRREVRVHRGARREADGLADLAHARGVAAVADLGVDELEHLALAGGQIGHRSTVTRSCVRGKHPFGISPRLDPNGRSCDAANRRSACPRGRSWPGSGRLPDKCHTPVVRSRRPHERRTEQCRATKQTRCRPVSQQASSRSRPGPRQAATHDAARRSRCRRFGPGRQPRHLLASTIRRRRHGGGAGARDGAGGCRARGFLPRSPRAPPSLHVAIGPHVRRQHGRAPGRLAVVGGRSASRPATTPARSSTRCRGRPPRHVLTPGETIAWDG